MTSNEPLMTADAQAVRTLDVHYSMQLGCSSGDLRRGGWTLVRARQECDPTALLFEQRPILLLVAPVPHGEVAPSGGVAMVAPELCTPVGALLRAYPPAALFSPAGLRTLDELMARLAPDRLTTAGEACLRLAYVTRASFRPYVGQWQEFIEPLDEAAETAPAALVLLARYGGGVFVVRQAGAIVSYAGLRSISPSVAEIGVRTGLEELRARGLGRAVVSRATKAALAADHMPLLRYAAENTPATRVAQALGYRTYADAIMYYGPAR